MILFLKLVLDQVLAWLSSTLQVLSFLLLPALNLPCSGSSFSQFLLWLSSALARSTWLRFLLGSVQLWLRYLLWLRYCLLRFLLWLRFFLALAQFFSRFLLWPVLLWLSSALAVLALTQVLPLFLLQFLLGSGDCFD